jgi:hypothetical protein
MLKRIRIAVVLAATVSLACSSSTEPKTPSYVGVYGLALVNAGGLPATVFQNSAGRDVLLNGTMTIRSDGSYTETLNYSVVLISGAATPETNTENGQYTVVGSQITFTIPAQGTTAAFSYTGAVSGSSLTYTYSGTSYTYQKQS